MMKSFRTVGVVVCLTLITAFAMPQDGLGKKKGGGGGGGGTSGGSGTSGGGSTGGSGGGGGGRVDTGGSRTGGGNRDRGNGGGNTGSGGTIGGVYVGGGSQNGGGGTTTGGWGNQNRGTSGRATVIDGLSRVRHPSRSGTVNYGSSNNVRFDSRNFRIDRARVGGLSQLDRKINRTDGRVGIVWGVSNGTRHGYRWGYNHYNRGWRDDYFWYPWYVFDPFSYNRFYCSPWYYYSFLPPYINPTRIFVVSNYYGYSNWVGDPYSWQRPITINNYNVVDNRDDRYDRDDRYNRSDRELDYAIDDLVEAFNRNDRRSASHLIPRSGSIAVFLDGQYNYSLNPDDFYDLFMDAVENAKTTRYMVEDVRFSKGVAKLTARHDFTDPDGQTQTVWHTFTLEKEGRDYVIREFGTNYGKN